MICSWVFAVIKSKRARALFHLSYHHGLRASEASLLQREDIQDKQGRTWANSLVMAL
jgi:integrase